MGERSVRVLREARRQRARSGKIVATLHLMPNGAHLTEIGLERHPLPLLLGRQQLVEVKAKIAQAETKMDEDDERADRLFERSERLL